MAVPSSLPQRVFLLAHDPATGRVPMGSRLGAVVRAAALADLYLAGRLTDDRGRAVVAARGTGHDPVLDGLLDEIAGAKPRNWHSWIDRRQNVTVRAVRQQLADGGWVRLEPRRVLGLFPVIRATVRDPRVRTELRRRVTAALKDPIGRVEPADAALLTIVAEAKLTLVLDRQTRRAARRRIEELTRLSGPVGPALRTSIDLSASGESVY